MRDANRGCHPMTPRPVDHRHVFLSIEIHPSEGGWISVKCKFRCTHYPSNRWSLSILEYIFTQNKVYQCAKMIPINIQIKLIKDTCYVWLKYYGINICFLIKYIAACAINYMKAFNYPSVALVGGFFENSLSTGARPWGNFSASLRHFGDVPE